MNLRKQMNDLMQERSAILDKAGKALDDGKQEEYRCLMDKARNMGDQIETLQKDISEQDRKFAAKPAPTGAEARDIAEERGNDLMHGREVKFTADEVRRAIRNSVTLATGTLVKPTGAGSDLRDPVGEAISSIVDQVRTIDLTGMGSYMEPYVITGLTADAGEVETLAGTARATSNDPTFGIAEIKPYEMNVTSFVDRNISRLSPANYYQKIYGMAMRAMRRKLADLIVNGDGEASHVMYGMKNATNKAGSAIYATENVSAIDVNLLDNLFFAYGSDDYLGPFARLLLTKQDLKAIGQLRGTNEKRRLFTITPDAGNPNTGMIQDGGVNLPYTLCSNLTSLSGATASSSAAIQTMIYGDPANYELGLFGEYSIRVDESVKAVERMVAILGDAMVGGNLIVHNGAVVATLPKSGS